MRLIIIELVSGIIYSYRLYCIIFLLLPISSEIFQFCRRIVNPSMIHGGIVIIPDIFTDNLQYLEPGLKQAKDIKFVGPTLKGVGEYPDINNISLKLPEQEIYCIGDCSGIFRGIIPSMLSGFYVAELLNT